MSTKKRKTEYWIQAQSVISGVWYNAYEVWGVGKKNLAELEKIRAGHRAGEYRLVKQVTVVTTTVVNGAET